ncbi:MAG: hypothetical protein AAF492_20915, partial [Verrucomicrobiota bacterium]
PNDGTNNPSSWSNALPLGTFTSVFHHVQTLTGFAPNETVFFSWRLTNAATEIWSESPRDFVTLVAPRVTRSGGATPMVGGARLNAGLTRGQPADVRIYWGDNDGETNPVQWDHTIELGTHLENGLHSAVISGLVHGIEYVYAAYATNMVGEDWTDNPARFFSLPPTNLPLSTPTFTPISATSTMVGTSFEGSGAIYTITLYWGQTNGGTDPAGWANAASLGTFTNLASNVNTVITGLEPCADHFVSWAASNPAGTNWLASPVHLPAVFEACNDLEITFCGYEGMETLTNFPALVRLGDHVPLFSYERFRSPTGGDLRFYDPAQTRVLAHEIEVWDTNGVSIVWVNLPELAGTDTVIHATWDSSRTNHITTGTVWPSGYQAVYHLNEAVVNNATNGVHQNAVGNGLDGGQNGNSGVPGLFGLAQDFSGSGEYIDTPIVTDQTAGGPGLTYSAWILPRGRNGEFRRIFDADGGANGWSLGLHQTGFFSIRRDIRVKTGFDLQNTGHNWLA